MLNAVKTFLAEQHPTITRQIGDAVETLTKAEREDLLEEWARNLVSLFLDDLRRQRDALLAKSDWTQMPDASCDAKAWREYRQALRDLPDVVNDPTKPVQWPEPPK